MGRKWDDTDPVMLSRRSLQQPLSSTPQTDDQRREILQKRIVEESRRGWRVQHESSFFASLVKGKRPNHILHLLLSVLTFGIWLPVWIILGLSMGERVQTIEVDKFGNSSYR